MAVKRLRGWDEFVKEAETTYEEKYKIKSMEFALSEDEVYTVEYPTLAKMRLLDEAMRVGDYDTAAKHLFGEALADRLVQLSADLHVNPLVSLVWETITEFGIANVQAAAEEVEAEAGKDEPEPSTKPAVEPKRSTGGQKKSSSTSSTEE